MGIDASAENIAIASTHASQDPLLPFGPNAKRNGSSLSYRQIAAEDLQREGKQYDLVCSMEVLEHVDAPGEFLKCLGDMVKVSSGRLLGDWSADSATLPARRSPRSIDHLAHAALAAAHNYTGGKHPATGDSRDAYLQQVHPTIRTARLCA